MALFCASLYAAELRDQTLMYAVNYRGTDAGELEISISRDGDEYLITSVSHLSMIAQVFLQSYTIETRFSAGGGLPALQSGKESLNSSGDTVREFTVNTETGKVEFADGEPVPFDATTRIDADAFPLGLILSDPKTLIGKPYLSVSPKRARLFAVQEVSVENIEVPAGQFDSTLVKSARPDDADRFIHIWLKNGDNPVPLKIVSGNPGKVTTMTLLP